MKRILSFVGALLALGCGDYGTGGEYGVTPGGAQDIGYARELVEDGRLPPANAITVEGLLSEHDLPTVGEPCEGLLCVRPAVAMAPSLETGANEVWLHVGMTSGLSGRERPPVDLTVVVDRSSSMAIDMDETNEAVINLLETLRPEDRVSVLAFSDDVRTIHPHGTIADREALYREVRDIRASGSFRIMPALERAVEIQRATGDDPARLHRVVVLSCGYPPTSGAGSFGPLAEAAAADGIGFTVVGVLLGYSPDLADLLGQTRGGNAFYTGDLDQTAAFFSEDADFMISPLAYDLQVGLELDGYEVDRVFGVPGDDPEPSALVDVTTAFSSSRRGGLVVRLRRTDAIDQELGAIELGYEPESAWALGSETVSARETATLPPGDATIRYGSDGVRKAVALVNQAEVLIEVLESEDTSAARARIAELRDYLSAEAEALDDDGLRNEVAFVSAIEALL